MLLSYFGLLLACGIVIGSVDQENFLDSLLGGDVRNTLTCSNLAPSPTVPTSVHALRPADIKHVAAMGDSLTAANGAVALTVLGLLVENRGVSWSIGGADDLSKTITLPNILKKFNSNLSGYSTANGDRDSATAGFNVAKPGAVSADMPEQANMLVERMIAKLSASQFNSEWKLVTFFIGGNDLCAYCKDTNRYSTANYTNNIKQALDILHNRMPRTLVNFVTVLNVAELEDLHQGVVCKGMQGYLCDCAIDPAKRELVRGANLAYQAATNQLIDSGIYDTRDDFTIVRQPFMEHMKVPTTADNKTDFSYFATDCFHFSKKGHQAAATELWNNMMQRVGAKDTWWQMQQTLLCPSSSHGYIYTRKNS